MKRLALTIAVAAAAAPRSASAVNCPAAVQAVYQDLPCTIVVNRSQGSAFHVSYDVDPVVVAGESAQTIRLFAFPVMPAKVPNWVNREQWEAMKADIITVKTCPILQDEPAPEDLLETHPELKDAYWELTVPIDVSVENAALGFEVDTNELPDGGRLPEGNYYLYSFNDPVRFSGFNPVPTVLRVIDDEKSNATLPPALFFEVAKEVQANPDAFFLTGQQYPLEGCVAGEDGIELMAEWRPDPGDWAALASCWPARGEFEIPFILPSETALQPVFFRVRASSPNGLETELNAVPVSWGPDGEPCTDPERATMFPYCEAFVEGDPDSLPDLLLCDDDDSGGSDDAADDTEGTDDEASDTDTDPDTDGDGDGALGESGGGSGCSLAPQRFGVIFPALLLLWPLAHRRRFRSAPRFTAKVSGL